MPPSSASTSPFHIQAMRMPPSASPSTGRITTQAISGERYPPVIEQTSVVRNAAASPSRPTQKPTDAPNRSKSGTLAIIAVPSARPSSATRACWGGSASR